MQDNPSNPQLLGYPSKSVALTVPETLIFRSDSNGEDLEGYAGAGLYDSVTMDVSAYRLPACVASMAVSTVCPTE